MSQDVPCGLVGVSGAVQGPAGYRTDYRSHTDRKYQVIVACNERVQCANALRIDSRNSSFTRKSCACVFVAGIISWAVDSMYLLVVMLTFSHHASYIYRTDVPLLPTVLFLYI